MYRSGSFLFLAILSLLFLAACSGAAAPTASLPTSPSPRPSPGATLPDPTKVLTLTPRPDPTLVVIPTVNTARHSVDLDAIYFDTFRPVDRAVPLSQASPELIASLVDAIPPLHNPLYELASQATWLRASDIVIGYEAGGQAWAYPARILNYHEIVNDDLAGEPVLISYCPLCYSGIVYSRVVGGRSLTFGNTSALYESDLVMLDYETGSYWWQVAGRAIVGPLTEQTLTVLPSATTTWGAWSDLHPGTLVLARDTGYARDYDRDPFVNFQDFLNQGRFAFPVSDAARDARLQPGEIVLVVQVGTKVRAYPLASIGEGVINDSFQGQAVVIFVQSQGPSGAAFLSQVDGQDLEFELFGGEIQDTRTGSRWDLGGRAVAGPLEGVQLPALPSKTTFWFSIVAAEPEIDIYAPEDTHP